jgi:hypothetical protein
MSNFQTLIESFVKNPYKRVKRDDRAYQQTDDFTKSELSRLLDMYRGYIEEDQTARLTRDAIEHHVRRYHDYCIEGRIGSHYRSIDVDEKDCVFEHILPANIVVAMLIEGRISINQALNTPTCLISKADDKILHNSGLSKSSPNYWYFFQRYLVLNKQFKTYNGQAIQNLNTFTLEDHFKLFGIV